MLSESVATPALGAAANSATHGVHSAGGNDRVSRNAATDESHGASEASSGLGLGAIERNGQGIAGHSTDGVPAASVELAEVASRMLQGSTGRGNDGTPAASLALTLAEAAILIWQGSAAHTSNAGPSAASGATDVTSLFRPDEIGRWNNGVANASPQLADAASSIEQGTASPDLADVANRSRQGRTGQRNDGAPAVRPELAEGASSIRQGNDERWQDGSPAASFEVANAARATARGSTGFRGVGNLPLVPEWAEVANRIRTGLRNVGRLPLLPEWAEVANRIRQANQNHRRARWSSPVSFGHGSTGRRSAGAAPAQIEFRVFAPSNEALEIVRRLIEGPRETAALRQRYGSNEVAAALPTGVAPVARVNASASLVASSARGGRRARWGSDDTSMPPDADVKITQFCDVARCSRRTAREVLRQAAWDLERALNDFFHGNDIFIVRCPYADCSEVHLVRRRNLGCRFRCGGNMYRGRYFQFPQRATRDGVVTWLHHRWRGRVWQGWPGQVRGCGRPFSLPENPLAGIVNVGPFLSWDERTQGTFQEIVEADPDGDYSRVT